MQSSSFGESNRPVSVEIGLPMFGGGGGGLATARLHMGHYQRMQAVIAAARSGDRVLIDLALKHHDEHGSGE